MNPLAAGPEDDRIRSLVAQAEASFASGQAREASLIFGRILAHDPTHNEAREGLERVRDALSEAERRAEAQLAEARAAIVGGDAAVARGLLEAVLASGGHHHEAAALLDRLDERPGVLLATPVPASRAGAAEIASTETGRSRWRRLFVLAWAAGLVLFAASLAFSWERLLLRLVEPPLPTAVGIAAPARLPRPTLADASLREARERLEASDPGAALAALERIEPSDAAWPFAQQLRVRAEAGLGAHSKEER